MQDYHNLDIWKRSHVHALNVRKATRKFPRSGYSELKKQMTTAAESMAFNIVEGCGARTQKDFARFLDITIKSAFELEYQLRLACDYGVLPVERNEKLSKETVEIRKMTYSLQQKVLASQ